MRTSFIAFLLSLTSLAFAACPADQPFCLYQNNGFSASDATNLYNTTTCSSSSRVKEIYFYYSQDSVGINEITNITLTDPSDTWSV